MRNTGYLINLKITISVHQSPILLLVTIQAYRGRTTDERELAGQIAYLKTTEERRKMVKLKRKEGKP